MWYVVENGIIVETFDTEDEAIKFLNDNDEKGTWEIYPEEGRIRK